MRQERLGLRACALTVIGLLAGLTQVSQAAYVYSWGLNGVSGRLGDGTTTSHYSPAPVANLGDGVTVIGSGGSHAFAVDNNVLYGWGNGMNGEVGANPAYASNLNPVPVVNMNAGVTAATGGWSHSLGIQNGRLFAWGANSFGQLGDYSTTTRIEPVSVSGMLNNVWAASAGAAHSVAIKGGVVYAWGQNTFGQVGDYTQDHRDTPVPVQGFGGMYSVTAIASGDDHNLAIENGAARAWGRGTSGQLGVGVDTILFGVVPEMSPIGLDSGVTAIAAGAIHSLAVKDGQVYTWGSNQYGQIGDGTTTQRGVPTLLTALADEQIVSVAGNLGSSYALSADGQLWAWGLNADGQLGLGYAGGPVLTPQQVLAPDGYAFDSIVSSSSSRFAIATLVPVPEPGMLVLAGVSLAGLARRRRK